MVPMVPFPSTPTVPWVVGSHRFPWFAFAFVFAFFTMFGFFACTGFAFAFVFTFFTMFEFFTTLEVTKPFQC